MLCLHEVCQYTTVSRDLYVTGSGKTDLMGIFAQIELLVQSEFAFNCASISAIDSMVDACIAKLLPTIFTVLAKHCFENRCILLHNDCLLMISICYVDACIHATCRHAHRRSECVMNGLLMVDSDSTVFLEECNSI